jgi:hypothetical protein
MLSVIAFDQWYLADMPTLSICRCQLSTGAVALYHIRSDILQNLCHTSAPAIGIGSLA